MASNHEMMNSIVIKRSSVAVALFIVLGVLLSITAFTALWFGRVEGWCFVPIALGSLIAGILGLRNTAPRAVLTTTGVTITAVQPEEIRWDEIVTVRIEPIPRVGNTIVLELKNGQSRRFYADALEVSATEIHRLLEERIANKSA